MGEILHARRYDHGYPHTPVILKVDRTEGLSVTDKRAISKMLHTSAEAMARQNTVCGFDLVDAGQEFLRGRNDSPDDQTVVGHAAYCVLSSNFVIAALVC